MKVIYKNQTEKHKNSTCCAAIEYPLEDKDISVAIIKLNGRYPDKGKVVNLKCKELALVIKGLGKLVVGNKQVNLKKGDLVLIDPEEKYYWQGNFTLFISSTPPWFPKQHKQAE